MRREHSTQSILANTLTVYTSQYPLHTPHSQDLSRRRSVARATDPARALEKRQGESVFLIQFHDSTRRLVREDDGASVRGEKLREAHLIRPGEILLCVFRELDVIGGIRVDEITGLDRERLKIPAQKLPAFEDLPVGREISHVVDSLVASEGDVELSLAVEAA